MENEAKDSNDEKAEHVSLIRILDPGEKVPPGKSPHRYRNRDGSPIRNDQLSSTPPSGASAQDPGSSSTPKDSQGRLKFDSWEDKQGGGKRSKLTVVIENFQFVGDGQQRGGGGREAGRGAGGGEEARGDGSSDDDGRRTPVPTMRETIKSRRGEPPAPPFGDEQHFKDDGIPF